MNFQNDLEVSLENEVEIYKLLIYLYDNKIIFEKNKFEPWILVKVGFMFYLSIKVTSLDDNEINFNFKVPVYNVKLCSKMKKEELQILVNKELNFNKEGIIFKNNNDLYSEINKIIEYFKDN